MIPYDVTRRCGNPRFYSLSPHRSPNDDVAQLLKRRDFVKDNKRNQIFFRPRIPSLRRVPAFTIQTEQLNTKPYTPIADPQCRYRLRKEFYAFSKPPQSPPNENLRKFLRIYEDHQFPVRVVTTAKHNRRNLEWKIDLNQLNRHDRRELFHRFTVGLPVEREPYAFIAVQGFKDLLTTTNATHLLAETLNEVVPNLRRGLNSKRLWKKMEMIELLGQIAQMPGIGQLLLPYYRMLLPPLRIPKGTRISTDISTTERDRLHNAIEKTLQTLEQNGGNNALINIKYLIPQYQSICNKI